MILNYNLRTDDFKMQVKGLHIFLYLIQSLIYFLEILENTKIYILQRIFQFHSFKNTGFSNLLFNVPKIFLKFFITFFLILPKIRTKSKFRKFV